MHVININNVPRMRYKKYLIAIFVLVLISTLALVPQKTTIMESHLEPDNFNPNNTAFMEGELNSLLYNKKFQQYLLLSNKHLGTSETYIFAVRGIGNTVNISSVFIFVDGNDCYILSMKENEIQSKKELRTCKTLNTTLAFDEASKYTTKRLHSTYIYYVFVNKKKAKYRVYRDYTPMVIRNLFELP